MIGYVIDVDFCAIFWLFYILITICTVSAHIFYIVA